MWLHPPSSKPADSIFKSLWLWPCCLSFIYNDPCDYSGPSRVIQDNLLYVSWVASPPTCCCLPAMSPVPISCPFQIVVLYGRLYTSHLLFFQSVFLFQLQNTTKKSTDRAACISLFKVYMINSKKSLDELWPSRCNTTGASIEGALPLARHSTELERFYFNASWAGNSNSLNSA